MVKWGENSGGGGGRARARRARKARERSERVRACNARAAPKSGFCREWGRTMWEKLKATGKPILLYGMGDGAEKIAAEL